MKSFKSLVKTSLIISFVLLAASPSQSQSGNQSDITGPDPIEMPSYDPTPNYPGDSGGNSGTGGNSGSDNSSGNSGTGSNSGSDNSSGNSGTGGSTGNSNNQTDNKVSQEDRSGSNNAEGEQTEDSKAENEQTEDNKTEDEQAEDKKADNKQTESEQTEGNQTGIDRPAFEQQLPSLDFISAVQIQEQYQAVAFSKYFNLDLRGQPPSSEEIAKMLGKMQQITGQKTALIYVSAQAERLETFTILPLSAQQPQNKNSTKINSPDDRDSFIRYSIPEATKERVFQTAIDLRSEVSNVRRRNYWRSAYQMYQWIIQPLAKELEANKIDNLVFVLDDGLRTFPLAALYDGKQFLIEKYSIAIVPSFGLTDISLANRKNAQVIAMGASQFAEQEPLPAVPTELQTVVKETGEGEIFLNRDFTVENFIDRNKEKQFGIIHLATHGNFQPGRASNSYIQFFDRELNLAQIPQIAKQLGWFNPQGAPDLLVLSACKTAVGDESAELGFAGLALGTGVKSALASLWNVSDEGTLGLMSEFYRQLEKHQMKAQALRKTQLAMLTKQLRLENGRIILSDGSTVPLPPELSNQEDLDLSHPYFWSAFTLIGDWN
jgi:CHAT domain-containing protein